MNDIVYVGRHALVSSVSRHRHENWEFVYCTYGSGTFLFDDGSLDYREGGVVIIPPMTLSVDPFSFPMLIEFRHPAI